MAGEFIWAALISFAITAISGKFIIPILKNLKFGQKILEIGPKWHMGKQGTPTMGGLMFILGIGVATFVVGFPIMMRGDYRHLLVFAFAAVFGWIGYIDDYAKVVKKRNKGLTAMQKLLLQITAAAVFLSLLRVLGDFTPNLYIPFTDIVLPMSWIPYLMFMMFVIIACVNAVNLTDGIDGLAASVTMPVALLFCVIAAVSKATGAGIFAAALFGALPAFLIYNFNPAKVFMGDTGSLFLGGAVCALAFAFDLPLILVFAGIIYILETVSVILQVLYFKISKGKRLFKMAPIHHHFEMSGWSEKKLCAVFTLLSAVGCVVGFLGIIGRFGL